MLLQRHFGQDWTFSHLKKATTGSGSFSTSDQLWFCSHKSDWSILKVPRPLASYTFALPSSLRARYKTDQRNKSHTLRSRYCLLRQVGMEHFKFKKESKKERKPHSSDLGESDRTGSPVPLHAATENTGTQKTHPTQEKHIFLTATTCNSCTV